MPENESLGMMLLRLRSAAGFTTPSAAAAACGVSPFAYRAWEMDRRPPDLIAAYLLSKGLKVPLEALAECLHRQVMAGPRAPLRNAPPGRRTARKMPGKPRHSPPGNRGR
jgi:transcriptional regulator with XRE-family HTH domain